MGRYAEKDRIGTNRKPSHLHALVWNPGYFLRIVPGLKLVAIHPDGEHAKTFDFLGRLGKQGLVRETAVGVQLDRRDTV